VSARDVAARWLAYLDDDSEGLDEREAYSKVPGDQFGTKTVVTPKSEKGLKTQDYESEGDENSPDVARLPQKQPEPRTKERGRALPPKHREDRDRHIERFVLNVPDAEPDSRSRTKTKVPIRSPGTPGEQYGHPTKYDYNMPTRRAGLKSVFPRKRQKNQGGDAKLYHRQYYIRHKSPITLRMKRRYTKLKGKMLYKRDKRYRRQYPLRYERRGIGVRTNKERSRKWRRDQVRKKNLNRGKERAKDRKASEYEWNLPAYLENGDLMPINIRHFDVDGRNVVYEDARGGGPQTLSLDLFLSRVLPENEDDVDEILDALEWNFGDEIYDWQDSTEDKTAVYDTFVRKQEPPGPTKTRRDRGKYHPHKKKPSDPAHRGQPHANPDLMDRGFTQPAVEQQSGSAKVIPDRNNSTGDLSWRNKDRPWDDRGYKVAGMTVKWGSVPPQWVYATKMPGYETLAIEVEGGGLYAEATAVRHCKADLASLSEQVGQPLKALVVQKTFLPEGMRGQGLGKKLYETAAREAAKKGYALAPNDCWHGGPGSGMTSPDARRVWASLRRQFVSEGLLLWGGRSPRAAMHRQADTIAMIRRRCERAILERSKKYKPVLAKFERRRLTWRWDVGDWKVSLRAMPKTGAKATNITEMDVRVSCSCPYYRWQGPEHWGKENGWQYGRPRGTATFPKIKDPRFRHAACKHAVAVFDWIRGNKLKIPEDMRRLGASRYLADSLHTYEMEPFQADPAIPEPSRVARRFLVKRK